MYPGQRIVVGPPNQDLDSGIPPVEAMKQIMGNGAVVLSVRCVLEGEDLEHLQQGQAVWLHVMGHLVPFELTVAP